MDVSPEKVPYTVTSKSYTAVAVNTAAKAGEWIKSKVGDIGQLATKSSSRDLVTEVDKGAEKMIRNLILTHFPHHAILGEEGVEPGVEAAMAALREVQDEDYVWVVDPIDGTTNFVHGFPFFSVSIALAYKGEIIVGVIYDPSRDELFVAEKGKGAYVRGRPVRVSAEGRLADCLLGTGFPADKEAAQGNLAGLQALIPKVRNIRTGGSAALQMAYVAAGRLSGFWEIGLSPWDVAAGVLMIREAGGTVTDFDENPYSLASGDIIATNGAIHREISDELIRAKTAAAKK